MQRQCSRVLAVLAGALSLSLFGCTGNGNVPVSGVVELNGKPYRGAVVSFQPIATDTNPIPGRGSTGITDENGRFILKAFEGGRGAVPGKHLVRITTRYSEKLKGYEVWDPAKKESVKSSTDPIPPPWNYNSKEEFEVPAGGTDQANFKIITMSGPDKGFP